MHFWDSFAVKLIDLLKNSNSALVVGIGGGGML